MSKYIKFPITSSLSEILPAFSKSLEFFGLIRIFNTRQFVHPFVQVNCRQLADLLDGWVHVFVIRRDFLRSSKAPLLNDFVECKCFLLRLLYLFAVQQTHTNEGHHVDLFFALPFVNVLEGIAIKNLGKLGGFIFQRFPCGGG